MTTPLSPAELAWMDATAQANLVATGKPRPANWLTQQSNASNVSTRN
ncbi:hypothetical protein [Candidatus Binatus sp.]